MEKNNTLIELALEKMGCISIVDKHGKYSYINECWSKTFSMDSEEAIGQSFNDFFQDVNIEEVLKTGKSIIYDNESYDNNIVYNAYIALIKDNTVCGVMIYREIEGMDNTLEFRKWIVNENSNSQTVYMDEKSSKNIKKLIYFDDLKLKEKQDILVKKTLEEALIKSKGNKAHAARMLGISRTVIYDKLKKYNLM